MKKKVMGMAYYTAEKSRGRFHFSKKEIQDLLIALGAIMLAFAIALSTVGYYFVIDWGMFPLALLISFLAVGTGFILHELAHKFIANRYGAWAEFRAWMQGLIMALVFAFMFGLVFAAPGAVYISGNITEEQNGKISLAGPIVNLAFAAVFLPLTFITSGTIGIIFFYIYYINAFLAVFNLIPVMPLDGAKVVKWNIAIYILVLGLAIGLLIPAFL